VDLFTFLGGSPHNGGSWTGPNGAFNGTFDPAIDDAGTYTYTVAGTVPCADDLATVNVIVHAAADAGTDAAITLCTSAAPVDLFSVLGGTPQTGGTWSGPNGAFSGTFDPATDDAGTYTYTVTGTAPCADDLATVNVVVHAAADAGADASTTLCSSDVPVDLFTVLGGTPQTGGTWAGPNGAFSGTFDPATDDAGTYTYTVSGTAPCADAAATVTVAVTATITAGDDAAIDLCANDAPIDLIDVLGGAPDPGGTWSGPAGAFSGTFDPATHAPGGYVYTVAGTAPCADASATVTVGVEVLPDAGVSADVVLCANDGPVDLFTVLGGTPQVGGTWAGPNGVISGIFDPSVDAPGDHVYTIAGTYCPDAVATVHVSVEAAPFAGTDAATTICMPHGPVDLLPLLGGADPGGTWTGPPGQQSYTMPLDPAVAVSGNYTYILSGGACPDDAATVTVTIVQAPQAGQGGPLAICSSSEPTSLFDGLTGTLDAGGTWTGPDGQGHPSVFDPAIDLPGPYTYTVSASPQCPSASSTVTVSVHPQPDAGENGAVLFCSSDPAVSLFDLLGGAPQPGGTWSGPGGASASALFNPGTGASGVYTYVIEGIAPCGDDQAQVMVTVTPAADAGIGGALTVCDSAAPFALSDALGGDPDSGTWTGPDGLPFPGVFHPALHASGPYTHTVAADAPCPAASTVLAITVIGAPQAVVLATGHQACAPAVVQFAQASPTPGTCTWHLGDGTVVTDCAPFTHTYETPGSYTVTLVVEAANGCGTDSITLPGLVQVHGTPAADFVMAPEFLSTSAPQAWFQNLSTGGTAFVWDFGDGTTATTTDADHTFPAQLGAQYEVCLTALAGAGSACADTVCRTVTIEDGLSVFLPNTFTPDGDGVNDTFGPAMVAAAGEPYRFEVFDRWGRTVFSTEDRTGRWDGTVGGGAAPVATYVWRLRVTDATTGAAHERMGHVTLLR
jgi:gliding motility-associated-like protein